MNIKVIGGHTVVLLIGMLLLIFNKQIGRFAEEKFGNLYGWKIEKTTPWFPRFNAVVIGLLFTIGAFLNLIDYIMKVE